MASLPRWGGWGGALGAWCLSQFSVKLSRVVAACSSCGYRLPGWQSLDITQGVLYFFSPQMADFLVQTGKKESEVAQSCPTLCNPVNCSLAGSSVHGIFRARVLERVAISFSRGSSQPRDQTWVSRIAGRPFTVWAIREVLLEKLLKNCNTYFYFLDLGTPGWLQIWASACRLCYYGQVLSFLFLPPSLLPFSYLLLFPSFPSFFLFPLSPPLSFPCQVLSS